MPRGWNQFIKAFKTVTQLRASVRITCQWIEGELTRMDTLVGEDLTYEEDEQITTAVDLFALKFKLGEEAWPDATSDTDKRAALAHYDDAEAAGNAALALYKAALEKNLGNLDFGESALARQVLDRMILEDIDWDDPSDEERAFAKKAIIARFDLAEDGLRGKWGKKALPKLYQIMAKLPLGHTVLNDKLKVADRLVTKRSVSGVHTGRTMTLSFPEHIDDLWERGHTLRQDKDILPECKITDKKVKSVVSHTTLHEIGHAVDSKQGFMNGHLNEDADTYGGWKGHTVAQLAELVGAHDFGKGTFFSTFARGGTPEVEVPRRALVDFLCSCFYGNDPVESVKLLVASKESSLADVPDPAVVIALQAVIDADEERQEYESSVWPEREEVQESISSLAEAVEQQACRRYNTSKKMAKMGATPEGSLAWATVAMAKRAIGAILNPDDPKERTLGLVQAWLPAPDPLVGFDHTIAKAWVGHGAVRFMRAVKASKGANGSWALGEKGAKNLTLGGRVIAIDVNDKLWSYCASARRRMVSNYQFHAPPEWFAELYAVYHEDKLPESHTDYDTIHSLPG